MAKHLYDKDGKYKGKILSDEEHSKNKIVIQKFLLEMMKNFLLNFFFVAYLFWL